ncbi:uncharacterized protein LOC123696988 [Colias croceus]|uniref:uncharacterized protein LOC123696988 n=1 Tax=Colias crocea TaxID=72248 RepID=UPI001E27BD9F|nr:uncharacterized protein LOC123696988 [Colias croceus]
MVDVIPTRSLTPNEKFKIADFNIVIMSLNNLFLIASICHVKGQYYDDLPLKPDKCLGTDELFNRKCCVFPPFFDREVARSCGGMFSLIYLNKEANMTIIRRETTEECHYWQCILDKYKILNSDKTVNEEKFFTYLDKWTTFNPAFSSIILSAKIHCRQVYRRYMPLTTCEFFSLQSCLRNFVNVDCPKVVNSKECFEWKEFFEECKEFFI